MAVPYLMLYYENSGALFYRPPPPLTQTKFLIKKLKTPLCIFVIDQIQSIKYGGMHIGVYDNNIMQKKKKKAHVESITFLLIARYS